MWCALTLWNCIRKCAELLNIVGYWCVRSNQTIKPSNYPLYPIYIHLRHLVGDHSSFMDLTPHWCISRSRTFRGQTQAWWLVVVVFEATWMLWNVSWMLWNASCVYLFIICLSFPFFSLYHLKNMFQLVLNKSRNVSGCFSRSFWSINLQPTSPSK